MLLRKKRFALLVPFMNLGGADRAGLDALRLMQEAGYENTVISTNSCRMGNRWENLFRQHAKHVVDVDPSKRDRVRRGEEPLHAALRQASPDVILINNSVLAYQVLPAIRASVPKARIACLFHMILKVWPFESHLLQFPKAWDLCIVTSNDLFNKLAARGINQQKMRVIYSAAGHPSDRFTPEGRDECRRILRERLDVSEHAKMVLFGFRFHTQKRPGMIAKIAARLNPQEYVFVCAGDGDLLGSTQQECASECPSHQFRWLGAVEWPDMQSLYAAADLMVLPSKDEGLPLSCFEAMDAGCPMVVSRAGGTAELVTEDVGASIPVGAGDDREVSLYVEAIESIRRESTQWDGKVRLGMERIERLFSWEKHAYLMHAALSGETTHRVVDAGVLFDGIKIKI